MDRVWDVAYRTEVGHVRARNEDAVLARPERGLVAVADGLGGHPAGDVASLTALRRIDELDVSGSAAADDLVAAIVAAHEAVLEAGRTPERFGMGTTIVLAVLGDARAVIGHVGDSRAYLREADGRLRQLTRDHGMRGMLTQALGLDGRVQPDVTEVDLAPGARLLLCTDGLTNMVGDDALADLLGTGGAQEACDALVAAALDAGGVDNVSVVVAGL